MPEQFTVPQFIDAEDKIFGSVTARQFVILMIAGMLDALLFKLISSLVTFLLVGIPILAFAGIVAFVRINGQPFHFFILNIIQTFKKPKLRVWDKTKNTAELRVYMKEELPEPPPVFKRKENFGTSRLQELSLVVNTGGVYKPDID
jgi:hypothetical protein